MATTMIELTLIVPVVGAIFIGLAGGYPNFREAVTLLTSFSLFGLVLALYLAFQAGGGVEVKLLEILPGLFFALATEPLGLLFALVASFLWLVTSIYSIGYMRAHKERNQTRFYVCFALALAAVMGITFSANLFTLFIFYELLTLTTYPLVTHAGTAKAKRAGRLYLAYLLGTSIGLQLPAIIGTWLLAGTLDFTDGGILAGHAEAVTITLLLALYVLGIGKAAIMPFHRWLPAAMVAPTPVSALLHAVAVVKAGVFAILKIILYIFGLDLLAATEASEWLIYLAATTILLASVLALRQDVLKARLAYSTVSQLAYIVLAAMLANSLSIIGGGMHILTHAFGKITLFFCAGAMMVANGKTRVSQMRGLGRTMPFTMAAFLIGSLSIVGLPPAGGMWSKWFLVLGTLEAKYYIPLAALLLSSLLSVAYLLPIVARGFFLTPENGAPGVQEAPLSCLAAMTITCCGCLALFFWPQPVYELMQYIFAAPATMQLR